MHPSRLSPTLATLVALVVVAGGCKDIPGPGEGTPSPGAASAADTVTVVIEGYAFRGPDGTDDLTVGLGQTVRFVNRDAAPHTATSTATPPGGPAFDSERLSQGDAFHWTPAELGTWEYFCQFHPQQMAGATVTVAESPPEGGDAPADSTGDGTASDSTGGGAGSDTTSTDGSGSTTPDTLLVEIVDFTFRGPDGTSSTTVRLGQTIRFVNRDRADHTATSTSSPAGGAFDSGNLAEGQSYLWTPGQEGAWSYVCEYHDEMTGSFDVVSDTASGGDGGGEEPSSSVVTVEITTSGFVGPDGTKDVALSLGDTVEWVNVDDRGHTASSVDEPAGGAAFDSGLLQPGDTYRFVPDGTGVWEYRCDEHSDEPHGTLTVQ